MKSLIRSILSDRGIAAYHRFLAALGALWYGYPTHSLIVVGVTGTKGKTSVTEMLAAIFEAAGHKTAVINSIRFKAGPDSEPNTTRMSMPGRFFIQRFLAGALKKGCTAAVLEMTSEGARQSRHRNIDLNALIFTNLAPEHIESHGSLEEYGNAKFEIGLQLARSRKRPRIMVANADDRQSPRYLTLPVEHTLPFSLAEHAPYNANESGGTFTFDGAEIRINLPGEFSLKNAIAAATAARALDIKTDVIARALEGLKVIPGRAEPIDAGQPFTVVVDYAHTPDSLKALYDAYKGPKICVLSATGGGRDTWKRPVMGSIAEKECAAVVLTDEDPYDEDPNQIVEDIAHGMTKRPEILLDRRAAIARALEIAANWNGGGEKNESIVLITGKGTNHSISVAGGREIPWDDATVVREEIAALTQKQAL